jgi:hypothetical protein
MVVVLEQQAPSCTLKSFKKVQLIFVVIISETLINGTKLPDTP